MESALKEYWKDWSAQLKAGALAAQEFRLQAAQPVTVVLTCKNHEHILPIVIPRLAAQTRPVDLVILGDDGSSDRSTEVFQELCDKHRLPHKTVSLGTGPNYRLNSLRNRLFTEALDGLVILLDSDLMVGASFVETHRRMHLQASSPVSTCGPLLESANPDGSGPVNFCWGAEVFFQVSPTSGAPLPAWNRLLGGNMGVMKSVWRAIGEFDPAFDGNYGIDDRDFHLRLHLAGVVPVGDFEVYVIHLPHPRPHARDISINEQKFLEKYGVDVYDSPGLPPWMTGMNWRGGTWSDVVKKLASGDSTAILSRRNPSQMGQPTNPSRISRFLSRVFSRS